MNKDKADEFLYETIPQALYHVESTDIDDFYGVKFDELILIQLIAENPQILKYKTLAELVYMFITSHESLNK